MMISLPARQLNRSFWTKYYELDSGNFVAEYVAERLNFR
ncbi:unnamed protein product [Tenebrio molitor]|nr:unnamed protein product [Tenebrio molitor]